MIDPIDFRTLMDQSGPPELTRDELLRCAKIATPDYSNHWKRYLEMMRAAIAADRARWGRPTPQPPADGMLLLQRWGVDHGAQPGRPLLCPMEDGYWTPWHIANALLQHQHPQPVAASERLPGPEDCDEQGRCWMFDDQLGLPSWTLIRVQGASLDSDMHWLPANALPTPEAQP